MNAQRRKEIDKIIDALNDLKPEINGVLIDEEDAMSSMPESLEGSERYTAMEEAVYNLEEADTYVDEVIEQLESAKGE